MTKTPPMIEVGRGTDWGGWCPIMRLGKQFQNGYEQVWVRLDSGRVKCFHVPSEAVTRARLQYQRGPA